MNEAYWLPVIFIGLMGLSVLVYAILDGYDLGVGILLPIDEAREEDRDTMIASIGPFWDANETWLVLAVGLMLIAFPAAHSLVFYHLYMPATVMLIGLILRGVAFDFRAKAAIDHKLDWDRCFKIGSVLTCLAQGYMLGQFVVGFASDSGGLIFSLLSAVCVTAAYRYIGACWLVIKTESELQKRMIREARLSGRLALLGVLAVCIVNPLVNPDVFVRWFSGGIYSCLWAIPLICFFAFLSNDRLLGDSRQAARHCWRPFLQTALVFLCCFVALCLSFFPDIVPNQMDIWEAASAPASLKFILVGAIIVVPIILAYTVFAYWVFRGKATSLHYH